MANDVLSSDEIDALLSGVDDGEIDTESNDRDPIRVRDDYEPYDLASNERPVRGRMPTLDTINARFGRFTRISLFNLLRHSPDVAVESVQLSKFGDYIRSLYVPTSMNLVRVKPLRGIGLVVIDAKLVFKLVDRFFGGEGRSANLEGRDFTPTEIRVVHRMLEQVFEDMAEAWANVFPIELELIGTEVNPSLANIVGQEEIVVVNSFNIELEGGGGTLHFTMPYTMLEPLRRSLETNTHSADETEASWSEALQQLVLSASVPLNCTIAQKSMNLREVIALKAGDVIPIDVPTSYAITAAGVDVCAATLGESRGKLALRVESEHEQH